MPRARKTSREKLETVRATKVVAAPRGRGSMLIPKPLDVDKVESHS